MALEKDLELVGYVVVERALRDLEGFGDVVERRVVKAFSRDDARCLSEHCVPLDAINLVTGLKDILPTGHFGLSSSL